MIKFPEKKKKTTKELSSDELLKDYRKVLLFMKLQKSSGSLIKTHQIRVIKKEIARLLTKQNQNKLQRVMNS